MYSNGPHTWHMHVKQLIKETVVRFMPPWCCTHCYIRLRCLFFCSHCFHLSGKRSLAWPALESSLYSLLISWASYMYYLLSNSPWRALMAILCGICNISCSSLAKHWRALCRCCGQCYSKYNSELSVHISITSTLGIWHVLPSCYPHSIHVRSLWNISALWLK